MRYAWILGLALFLGHARAAEQPLSFDDALTMILARSTSVATQKASLGSTVAKDLPIKLAFTPTISIEANQTTLKTAGVDATTTKQAQGVAKLNLFRFGADFAGIQAAYSDEDAQQALVDASVLKAEDTGVRVLVNAIDLRFETAILKRIAQSQEELLRIGRQRYQRGLLPLQEVEKLSVDLDNALANMRDSEIRENDAQADLMNALGRTDIVVEWPWKKSMALPDATFDPSRVPAMRAARSQLDAEDRRVQRNFRAMLPSFDSSFTYGYTKLQEPSYTPGWTGVLSLSVPLFDHLSNYSAYSAQTYARASAESALEQADRDANSEWQASSRDFKTAYDTARARDVTLGTSRKLYDDNLRRFQAGRINANDLSVDQNRLSVSERLAVQGWSAAHLAYSRLCHALGRRVTVCQERAK